MTLPELAVFGIYPTPAEMERRRAGSTEGIYGGVYMCNTADELEVLEDALMQIDRPGHAMLRDLQTVQLALAEGIEIGVSDLLPRPRGKERERIRADLVAQIKAVRARRNRLMAPGVSAVGIGGGEE